MSALEKAQQAIDAYSNNLVQHKKLDYVCLNDVDATAGICNIGDGHTLQSMVDKIHETKLKKSDGYLQYRE